MCGCGSVYFLVHLHSNASTVRTDTQRMVCRYCKCFAFYQKKHGYARCTPANRHRRCDFAHQMNNTKSFQQTHKQQRNSFDRKRVKPLRRQFFANFCRKTFDLFRISSAFHLVRFTCTTFVLHRKISLSMLTCLSFARFLPATNDKMCAAGGRNEQTDTHQIW